METARHLMPRRPRALRSTLPMWARETKDARLEYRLYAPAGPGQAWAVRIELDACAPRSAIVTQLRSARAELRGVNASRMAPARAEDAVQVFDDCLPVNDPSLARPGAAGVEPREDVLPSELAQMALF